MSTRATYWFVNMKGAIFAFYIHHDDIHHDGYPRGACGYVKNALDYMAKFRGQVSGGLPDAFLRANKGAELMELIKEHTSHGDTEYRYTFAETLDIPDRWRVVIEARNVADEWILVNTHGLAGFLDAYNANTFTDEELANISTPGWRAQSAPVASNDADFSALMARIRKGES